MSQQRPDASSGPPRLDRFDTWLATGRVFALLLASIVALKWPTLDQPPVWDGSMSVFPAAITLAHNGFDVADLLRQPGYFDGGPNVHALSLITWVTAAAYRALGDRPQVVLPLLHMLHFALAAWALTSVWRLACRLMPRAEALATAVVLLLFPPFYVQAGYLYLEVALVAFAAAAVDAWESRRIGLAATWATCAILVKPTGAVVFGCLALCTLVTAGTWRQRLCRTAILAVGPAAASGVYWLSNQRTAVGDLRSTLFGLLAIPDFVAVLVVFVVLGLWWRPWLPALTLGTGRDAEPAARVHLACVAMAVSFAAFFSLLVPLGQSVIILPRYYLPVFAFALIASVGMVAARSRRVAAIALVALAVFFVANRRGHFYPHRDLPLFPIVERSMAYVDLLELQDTSLRRLLREAGDEPVFYDLPVHFKLAYPEMGYDLPPRPANGHCIFFEPPYLFSRLQDFPSSFYSHYDFPLLGGDNAQRLLEQARADPRYEIRTATTSVGRFESVLVHIRRVDRMTP